jgi:hypothetical protein
MYYASVLLRIKRTSSLGYQGLAILLILWHCICLDNIFNSTFTLTEIDSTYVAHHAIALILKIWTPVIG